MYHVGIERAFSAEHSLPMLPNPDEQRPHRHTYRLQVELFGDTLDDLGFLIDITELEAELDKLQTRYENVYLNELEPFQDRAPTLEVFSDVIATTLVRRFTGKGLCRLRVTLWESDAAWAGCERELS
ncbi:6-carboxytetrahydropterin synthase [bacterium]|nr:6-carboxytetrahydropterin synthase [bacterium]